MLSYVFLGLVIAAGLFLFLRKTPQSASDRVGPRFRDGDTVCFVGDSITEDGRWTAYVQAFYLTRYSRERIRFLNAGIPGETAGHARRRLDWDVIPHAPNVISIMFGMNDAGVRLYGRSAPQENLAARREAKVEEFRFNMKVLTERLTSRLQPRPQLIFVSPPPYDELAQNDVEPLGGMNATLAKLTRELPPLARKFGARFVDVHTPLTQLGDTLRASDPHASVTGPDRMHPASAGHLAIAYLYLAAQKHEPLVSAFEIDAAPARVLKAQNGRVKNLDASDARIAFDCEEDALPFPIDDDARAALAWLPIAELNRQTITLRVDGDARYALLIDGEEILTCTADELRQGIDLSQQAHTPQARQAQRVLSALHEIRIENFRLRRFAQVKAMLQDAKIDPADRAASDRFFAQRAKERPEYFEKLFREFRETEPQVSRFEAAHQERLEKLHQLNQPVVRRYEFVRL